jgi:hypothetical protein
VADAGRLDLDQHFAGLRTFDIDGLYGQWFAGFPGNCSARLHDFLPNDGWCIIMGAGGKMIYGFFILAEIVLGL